MAAIDEILNPRSNVLILMDNNLLANPNCMDILREIRERNLVVDISQGIDCRLVTDEIAQELSKIKHLRHLHMAWDLMSFEHQVMRGIHHLKNWMSPKKLMCFVLVGYNTSFEEDVYRFRRLVEEKIEPFVMIYNNSRENRMLRHWARYINSHIFKLVDFNEYLPWIKEQQSQQNLRMAV